MLLICVMAALDNPLFLFKLIIMYFVQSIQKSETIENEDLIIIDYYFQI